MSLHMPEARVPPTPAVGYFIAGGFAGAVSKTCVAPYDRARILLQVGKASSPSKIFQDMYRKDGVKGFFKGNFINCMGQFASKGVLFGFNDLFKSATRFIRIKCKDSGHVLLSWVPVFLSGSLAGFCVQTFTYPIDVIRVRFAAQMGKTRYTGFFKTLAATLKMEGLTALYRGGGPTFIGALVYEGIKFGVFDIYTAKLRPLSQKWDISLTPVAGAIAGLTAIVATHPNDTVRRRMQLQGLGGREKRYTSAPHAYYTMLRKEGIRSFYRGLGTSVVGKVPGIAIQFTVYSGIKKGLKPVSGSPPSHSFPPASSYAK